MKFDVKTMFTGTCRITLIPESSLERSLLSINSDADKLSKAGTLEYHYQRAVNAKYGPKAHLLGFTEVRYPNEVQATYVIEGPYVGK